MGTGCVLKTSLVATTSGLMEAEVTLTKPPAAAVSTKLASASLADVYFTPLKVAVPFEAVTVVVPVSEPLPFSLSVTDPLKSVSILPRSSTAITTG
ncbi:Uncharacterised protein [Comamonas aquatica]|nr:Uncharacterised protein [Comamonas aquatica]